MELPAKIIDYIQPLSIFTKHFILGVSEGYMTLIRLKKILVDCHVFHKNLGLQSLQTFFTFKFNIIIRLHYGEALLITNLIHLFFDFKNHPCSWVHIILISHYLPVQTRQKNCTPILNNVFRNNKEIQSELHSIVLTL